MQRLVLDLADALAADPQLLADFGQRVLVAIVQAEAQPQHQLLARGERIQRS